MDNRPELRLAAPDERAPKKARHPKFETPGEWIAYLTTAAILVLAGPLAHTYLMAHHITPGHIVTVVLQTAIAILYLTAAAIGGILAVAGGLFPGIAVVIFVLWLLGHRRGP